MVTLIAPRKIVATATASATLARGSHTPVDATSGALTMTLPANAPAGVENSVEKTDASANAVTVSGTLRGVSSSITLSSQYEARTFLSDGAGSWTPISDHRTAASLNASFAPLLVGGKPVLRQGDSAGVLTVTHGSDPNVARPDIGTGTVRWIGPVQPLAMTASDLWIQTVDPSTINPLTIAPWSGVWYTDSLKSAGAADGSVVSSWTDGTGNARHLTPTTAGTPTMKYAAPGYNGQAAVKFSASPVASPAFGAMAQPNTVVLIANASGITPTEGLLADAQGGFGGQLYKLASPNQWKWTAAGATPPVASAGLDLNPHLFVLTASTTATVGDLRIDGVDFKANTGGGTRTRVRLGLFDDATTAAFFGGHIAFAALLSGTLTTSQLSLLETWARAKYGLNF